jgi:hypothetical protein
MFERIKQLFGITQGPATPAQAEPITVAGAKIPVTKESERTLGDLLKEARSIVEELEEAKKLLSPLTLQIAELTQQAIARRELPLDERQTDLDKFNTIVAMYHAKEEHIATALARSYSLLSILAKVIEHPASDDERIATTSLRARMVRARAHTQNAYDVFHDKLEAFPKAFSG